MTAVPPSGGSSEPLPDRLLTLREVAAYLRYSVRSVRRLIAVGRLPVVRLGRAIRVRRCDLEAFVASCRQERTIEDKGSAGICDSH
jgi:excisionase family DNA binding protein